MRLLNFMLAPIVFAIISPVTQANDKYYMVVFASQTELKIPRGSHSFAAFVKVSGDDPTKRETVCISWLPKSMQIDSFELPEEGHNLCLPDTLEWTRKLNAKVTMWGPYAIKPELYEMAAKHVKYLESKPIGYVVIDKDFRGKRASNCIHALADLVLNREPLDSGTFFGVSASEAIVKHFQPFIVKTDEPLAWLVEHLKLDRTKYKIGKPE